MDLNFGNEEIKLNNQSMIVTETDSKGIITFTSEDFCTISGYTSDELVGQPHNMIRHNFMPKAAFQDLWNTVQKGKIWSGTVINKTKSGGYYWVKATVYPSKSYTEEIKYISVRIMPSEIEIQNAISSYSKLN